MAGIDGVAVGITAVGGFLLWSGIRNVPVVDGLREILAGRVPAEGVQTVGPTAAGSTPVVYSGVGAALVAEARRHIGKPYVWGTEGPATFDCSGLVVYSLNQIGVKVGRLTAAGFMRWGGATTIERDLMQPGDLVCWGGHIGIAASATTMIEAPNRRNKVREGQIWKTPTPVIRRVGNAAVKASASRQAAANLRMIG